MKPTYNELLAVFGDYAEEYEEKAANMLAEYSWDVIVHYMDDDIREEIHGLLAPCDNEEFLIAYMGAHATKFSQDFMIC